MGDEIKNRIDVVQTEILSRKRQLTELRLNYSLAKDRLVRVERQIKSLEYQLEQLSQGQLPLDICTDDSLII